MYSLLIFFLATEVIEDNYTGKLNGTTWDHASTLPLIHSMNHQTRVAGV